MAHRAKPVLGAQALQIDIARTADLTVQKETRFYEPAQSDPLRNLLARVLAHIEMWEPIRAEGDHGIAIG